MTDRDKTPPSDTRQDGLNRQSDSRNRATQDAESRPGVDAGNGLDDRGHMTDSPRAGSAYRPLSTQQDEPADRDPGLSAGQSGYVDQQGVAGSDDYLIRQNQERDAQSGHEGVSRAGAPTQHGDVNRESQSAPGGGSVFQPLEASPRNEEDLDSKQRGNPSGQNQQGLNQSGGRDAERGERNPDEPRGTAPDQGQRRP